MKDVIEKIDGALIQHGPCNDRVFIMDAGSADPDRLVRQTNRLAERNGYSKIYGRIPKSKAGPFLSEGFEIEASIPGFYLNKEKALFLSSYLNEYRQYEPMQPVLDDILRSARRQKKTGVTAPLHSQADMKPCCIDDIRDMTRLFRKVFASYPVPIHDSRYLAKRLQGRYRYNAVQVRGRIRALAAVRLDSSLDTAELTDVATDPDWRGQGFANALLNTLEKDALAAGVTTVYSVTRAASTGINMIFARSGYTYGGRLINNTQIAGHIESMNVWYKSLNSFPSNFFITHKEQL